MSVPSTSSIPNGEWLETDGLGGYASGNTHGPRSRRYHALLLVANTPPTQRYVLVNGWEAWVEVGDATYFLTSQHYAPDVVTGPGVEHLEQFQARPWPQWTFRLPGGIEIQFELLMIHGQPITCLQWKLLGGASHVRLRVRPFLSGRDYHSLHHANSACHLESRVGSDRVSWQPYPQVPGVTAFTNGSYESDATWYYRFVYSMERDRGLDYEEDLASPGIFSWDLSRGPACWMLTTQAVAESKWPHRMPVQEELNQLQTQEWMRRNAFPTALHAAADAYVVRRGEGRTIVAGYPWFTDWGRDTFIALRGLCIATGRLEEAEQILVSWADAVSEGMLPNRFPDGAEAPEYNSVDASLWYIIAVFQLLQAHPLSWRKTHAAAVLEEAVQAILEGYSRGTRFGIHADSDGLLACGVPGVQLTWMDAKVGDWVVTPRVGKPVEVQALWLNALWVGTQFDNRWQKALQRGLDHFEKRFWNPNRDMLYDNIDVNGDPGVTDDAFRPNQIFALGGLPLRLIRGERAQRIVEQIESHLWTPMGLRTLAPTEPGYIGRYEGGVRQRDGAYHQGTVWPWLTGAFVDAWIHTHEHPASSRSQARRRFVEPLLRHLEEAGIGHLSEIADGDFPHSPRGCPWQAWSLGELLWLEHQVQVPKRKNTVTERYLHKTRSQPSPSRIRSRREAIPNRIPKPVETK